MFMMHVFIICHDFLYESHHLQEISEHEFNCSQRIEFTLFFMGIEFHLACIERIKQVQGCEPLLVLNG